MFEFLADTGWQILAGVFGAGGAAAIIVGTVYMFRIGRKVKAQEKVTKEEIEITKEGIVEAFKTATVPNEIKVSLTNQLNTFLSKFRDDIITNVKENTDQFKEVLLFVLKILAFTAASNKLTTEEQNKLNQLIQLLGGEEIPVVEVEGE